MMPLSYYIISNDGAIQCSMQPVTDCEVHIHNTVVGKWNSVFITDDTAASDEHASREETPVVYRRMTLISEEEAAAGTKHFLSILITLITPQTFHN